MFKTLIYGVAALSLVVSVAAFADDDHEHPEKGHHMFKRLDENNDGVVTRSEFVAHMEKRFDRMDANSDGKVTEEEAREHHEHMREKRSKHRSKRRD